MKKFYLLLSTALTLFIHTTSFANEQEDLPNENKRKFSENLSSDNDPSSKHTKPLQESNLGALNILDHASLNDVSLLEKSANNGNSTDQCSLGIRYYKGDGVDKNLEKAVELFEKSANNGDSTAQFILANMYLNGDGVDENLEKAVEWFEKSANSGNSTAQNRLGWMYLNGEGVDKNLEKAMEWFEKSANNGNSTAQNILAWAFASGLCGEINFEKATELFEKSGTKIGRNYVKQLYLKLLTTYFGQDDKQWHSVNAITCYTSHYFIDWKKCLCKIFGALCKKLSQKFVLSSIKHGKFENE